MTRDPLADTDAIILQEARDGKGQDILIAAAILTLSDGTERVAFFQCEYGDNDANNHVAEFCNEARNHNLLRVGERIRAVLWRASVEELKGSKCQN